MRHRGYSAEAAEFLEDAGCLAVERIVAGRMVEVIVRTLELEAALQQVSSRIHNPLEQLFGLHAGQTFPAGPAGDYASVEVKIGEHSADLGQQNRIAKNGARVLGGFGIYVGRKTAAEKGRRQNHARIHLQQHMNRGHGDVGEEALGTAPWEVEDRLRLRGGAGCRRGGLKDQRLIRFAVGQHVAQRLARISRQRGTQHLQRIELRSSISRLQRSHQSAGQALRQAAEPNHGGAEELVEGR